MFFSNKDYDQSQNKSSILAYASFYQKERESLKIQYDFSLKIHLPETSKRLKVVVEKEQDDIAKVLSDNSRAESSVGKNVKGNTNQRNSYAAGINYFLSSGEYIDSSIDSGLRFDLPLNPFIKLNFQKEIQTKPVNIYYGQKFILYRQEGGSEVTQLSFSKKWSDLFQTALNNSMVWTDKNDAFLFRNNLVLNFALAFEKNLSLGFGANATPSPVFNYTSYDTSLSYHQLLYSNWLYGYASVGAEFLKENDWKNETYVQLRFEVFFR